MTRSCVMCVRSWWDLNISGEFARGKKRGLKKTEYTSFTTHPKAAAMLGSLDVIFAHLSTGGGFQVNQRSPRVL